MIETKTPIAIIIAVAQNGVIGRDNQLPWRIPAEMKYFKATTMGKPIVMGRKTFESLGKPLPGRTNIVVTRAQDFAVDGVVVAHSVEAALQQAAAVAARDGASEIMVIGGAEIYRQALPFAQRIYYTEVALSPEGDAHFRDIDWREWRCVQSETFAAQDANTPAYNVMVWQRA